MKTHTKRMTTLKLTLLSFFFTMNILSLQASPARQFYQLIIYHLADKTQEERLDQFLFEAYLPELHRSGIASVGVFKTLNIDTATKKRTYVLIPFRSLEEFHAASRLFENPALMKKGGDYLLTAHDKPVYIRKESILMEAFSGMPELIKPQLNGPRNEQVYELRSYESASEALYLNKVAMFNDGEIDIFKNIGSQPLFFGEVLAGNSMPNLMYMTAYENMNSRNEKWNIFSKNLKWKEMSSDPQYQNNMNKANVYYVTPTDYSDF